MFRSWGRAREWHSSQGQMASLGGLLEIKGVYLSFSLRTLVALLQQGAHFILHPSPLPQTQERKPLDVAFFSVFSIIPPTRLPTPPTSLLLR